MPKTISEALYNETSQYLVQAIEPKIKEMIDAVNVFLIKNKRVRVGIDIKWMMEELTEEEVEEELDERGKSKSSS